MYKHSLGLLIKIKEKKRPFFWQSQMLLFSLWNGIYWYFKIPNHWPHSLNLTKVLEGIWAKGEHSQRNEFCRCKGRGFLSFEVFIRWRFIVVENWKWCEFCETLLALIKAYGPELGRCEQGCACGIKGHLCTWRSSADLRTGRRGFEPRLLCQI